MVGATAHSSEATMNSANAANISRLRPSASPNRPYTGAAMVVAIRYATTTQEIRSTSPNAPAMAGKAVATIVASTAARNIGRQIDGNTRKNSPRVETLSVGSGAADSASTGSGVRAGTVSGGIDGSCATIISNAAEPPGLHPCQKGWYRRPAGPSLTAGATQCATSD